MTGTCDTIALDWFSSTRQRLENVPSEGELIPQLVHAFRFLHHPRMRNIRMGRGFVLEKDGMRKRLDGLTSQLKEVFHPMSMSVSTGGMRTGGASRGSAVDKEIEDIVNYARIPETGNLHKYTVKTLQHLYRHRLQPFACQVPVYDGALGIATTLDIICIDLTISARECRQRTNLVNIQLKTGFENNNYKRGQGYMTSPLVPSSALTRMEDSHYARHQIQLLVEHMILSLRYDGLVGQSRIVVISEDRHSSYPLSDMVLSLYNDVYHNLVRRKQTPPWETMLDAREKQDDHKNTPKTPRKRTNLPNATENAARNQRVFKKAKEMFT